MNLDVKQSQWDEKAAMYLLPACDDTYPINDVAYDVQSQKISLFNVYEGDNHCASMVLRLDDNELVVVAVGGQSKTGQLIQCLCDFWDRLAIINNAKTIRAHVSKKGMAKLMERAGGVLSEYVYRKEVNYGR